MSLPVFEKPAQSRLGMPSRLPGKGSGDRRAPRIGFDRFIALNWATAAMNIRAGNAEPDELNALLDAAKLGPKAEKNTHTVLNNLWLEPRSELVDYANRAVLMLKDGPNISAAALCWGMAISTYPFFGNVAEMIGRLSGIQGDCSVAELQRRMSERYGEGESTKRATSRIIQSLVDWDVVERTENGKRILLLAPTPIDSDALTVWLIEAAVRYTGRPVSVPGLQSLPLLFPFNLTRPLAYVVSRSSTLDLRSEGPSNQVVALDRRVASV